MNNKSAQFKNSNKGGFTLIELLVVITIMTIMTGIGAGIFTGANQKLRVQKAASSLLMMAQYARMSAIEEQRAYKLYVDNTNNEFYLATTDFDDNGAAQEIIIDNSFCAPVTLNSPIAIEDVRVLSNDYSLGNTSKNMYLIAFAPDGTSQDSLVQIGDGQVHYTLSINEITGKTKLYPTIADNVKIDTIDLDAQ